jgi:hypothetical protein
MNDKAVQTTQGPALPQNPFQRQIAEHINAGTVEIESNRAIAEAQGKLVIAKRFPRNPQAAFDQMMASCRRPSFALQAMYSYPKGGTTVSGPSIRMAEELARNWGNIEFGTRELSRRDGESEMEAYAWDLETNIVRSIKFTVRHVIDTKHGAKAARDERDIYEITANQGGRRVRACVLAILPPDYVDSAVQACNETLKAEAKSGTLADRLSATLKAFSGLGVTVDQIEVLCAKTISKLDADDFTKLQGIFVSLRDGHSKVDDFFVNSSKTANADTKSEAAQLQQEATATKKKKGAPEQAAPQPVQNESKANDDEGIIP